MTYSESAKGVIITRDRAYREVVKHSLQGEWIDCLDYLITKPETKLDDEGNIVSVDAGHVMEWLGY